MTTACRVLSLPPLHLVFATRLIMEEVYQQEQRSDGSRSRTGCITCRIRRKRCDQQRPACNACQSRQLACYGFNAPIPSWYTSKASREEARNSDEAKSLRTLAETRYKIYRKVGPRNDDTTTSTPSTEAPMDDDRPYSPRQLQTRLVSNTAHTSPSSVLLKSGVNIWQLRPESLWWDSKIRSIVPDPGSSSREETRLLLLFLDVIHPITHTFYKLSNSTDRSWMLDRLVNKRSLYCSALSVSACFDHSLTQPPSVNDIGICSKVRDLQSRTIYDLRAEIDEFASMKSTPLEDFVWAGIQLLDVITHLLTLEIFSMLGGHWEMHHQASRKILNHIEIHGRRKAKPNSSVIGATLSSLPPDSPRRRSLEFCISGFIWIDVAATSAFGARHYTPCAFDYLDLLDAEVIKPQYIMGCQGWIMAIVSRIARLEQWKVEHLSQMNAVELNEELTRQSKQIADDLQNGIERLESADKGLNASGLEEDSRLISIIWAYGAQVLREATLSDWQANDTDLDQNFVNLCLQKLEALPTRLRMRTTWPYTIAGSMAATELQQARFRWIFGKTMQEAQPPGISWKGLMVMEECWRLRSEGKRKIGWREGMESLGVRVILT